MVYKGQLVLVLQVVVTILLLLILASLDPVGPVASYLLSGKYSVATLTLVSERF